MSSLPRPAAGRPTRHLPSRWSSSSRRGATPTPRWPWWTRTTVSDDSDDAPLARGRAVRTRAPPSRLNVARIGGPSTIRYDETAATPSADSESEASGAADSESEASFTDSDSDSEA